MYAIFEAKGKQWRAEDGATLRLPSLEAEAGERVVFDRVLLAAEDGEVIVGRPTLSNASVALEVLRHGKGEKIVVFKMKRRKNYRRKQGHRQKFTEVKVVEIDLGDRRSVEPSAAGANGASAAGPATTAPAAEEDAPAETEAQEVEAQEVEEAEAEAPEIDITDSARELAEDEGIDITALEGTGKDGRILKSDVQEAVSEAGDEDEAAAEPTPAAEADEEAEAAEEGRDVEEIDITPAAAELADEEDVDITALEGTGKDGRILKSDVQDAIKEREEE